MPHPPGSLAAGPYDAILLLVPHRQFVEEPPATYLAALVEGGVFYDLKAAFPADVFEAAGKKWLSL